jgi:D-mannonate dehydratase
MWANITYFLKAVIPVAEQSGVNERRVTPLCLPHC